MNAERLDSPLHPEEWAALRTNSLSGGAYLAIEDGYLMFHFPAAPDQLKLGTTAAIAPAALIALANAALQEDDLYKFTPADIALLQSLIAFVNLSHPGDAFSVSKHYGAVTGAARLMEKIKAYLPPPSPR